MNSLPIIDISPFLDSQASEDARLKTARDLDSACRNVGFFYISHHNITIPELNEILSLAHAFFALPSAAKNTIKMLPPGVGDGDGSRGYQSIGENVTEGKRDWHEGLDLYRPVLSTKPPYSLVMGVNKWPPGEFRRVYEMYIEKLLVLGGAVMHAIALGLGEKEDYFDEWISEPFWVMRAIGYPPLETQDDGGISCGEHTGTLFLTVSEIFEILIEDYGCLTFLIADAHATGSLQVKLRATGEWISADPIEGCFVCNIGDMMQVPAENHRSGRLTCKVWTNNQYTSTLHRVIHKSRKYRVSVPFFFEPNFDAIISPIQSCIDKDRGERKVPKKIIYGEHLLKKVSGNFYKPAPPS